MANVKISKGNTKTGAIPAISKTPIKSCNPAAPCFKSCYALKAYRQYPSTKAAWDHNLAECIADPAAFWQDAMAQFSKCKSKFIRVHVSGDFISQQEVDIFLSLAAKLPAKKFLAFTKQPFNFSAAPANVSIVASQWGEWANPAQGCGSKAYVRFKDTPPESIPDNAVECPGRCYTCGACWGLAAKNLNVVFDAH